MRRLREIAPFIFVATFALTTAVLGQTSLLLVNDPLTTGDVPPLAGSRYRGGIAPSTYGAPGTFVVGEGWKVTQGSDAIYYHLPYAVSKGKAEFEIKGLYPNELRGGMRDKTELFHMYDNTYQNADNNYTGYRNNPFKMYIRKIGLWDVADPAPNVNKFELVWQIQPAGIEPDSNERPNWDPNTWYKFEVEWGPTSHGYTVLTMKMNGMPITAGTSFWQEGWWNPGGHSIRLAGIHPSYGGPVDGVYRNVKVYQYAPIAPTVVRPVNGATYNTTTPTIEWVSEPQTRYQARVCAANDPNSGIAWDSGQVTSTNKQITPGALSNNTTYYVFVRIANSVDWSPWSALGYSFKIDTSYVNPRTGNTSVTGDCMADNGGRFLAIGATYMRGMQRCKYYRDRFKRDLSVLAANNFNYVRILTMVSWNQMQIAPKDINMGTWTLPAWTDYWQQFRDTIDIAYDQYGIRTEITIFAAAQDCMPSEADRYAHMDGILSNLAGRQHKVMMIEVANEFWQNGFDLPGGINKVREFGCYLAQRTTIPIALSSPYDSGSDPVITQMYSGSCADITTVHLTRDVGTSEGGWLPVRDSWRIGSLYPTIPPASSNEPVGPGYVPGGSEDDPIKLCSAAVFAWISKLPMYVYHSRPGVGGVIRPGFPNAGEPISFEESPGVDAFKNVVKILPSNLPNWTRNDGKETTAPFTAYCNGQANKYWTDIGGATTGCHRNIGSRKGCEFVCYPQGILPGGVTLQARQDMTFTIYNPLTGAVVMGPVSKTTGQSLTLTQGPGAYVIRGSFGNDTTPPGSATNFTAAYIGPHISLSWTNPSDPDLAGALALMKTGGYPANESDGTVIFSGAGSNCGHSGVTGGTTYYYSLFCYDGCENYAARATASVTTPTSFCYADAFFYPDGALNGNNGWSGTAATEISVVSGALKIAGGGSTNLQAIKSVSCSGGGGVIWVEFKVNGEVGTTTLWGVWIDDAAGLNLARWYGQGTTARPRIGGTGLVLNPVNLTGAWDFLGVKINTNTDTDEFFFNGVSIGTLSHSSTGAGNSVGRIRFERVENAGSGDHMYIDNIIVGPPDTTPPSPPTNLTAGSRNGQVVLGWTNPTVDFVGSKLLFKTTGYPTGAADGTVLYDGVPEGYIHSGLTNGIRYYYSVFAHDGSYNYSTPAKIGQTPALDATIPQAEAMPDNQIRSLKNKTVTAVFSDCFYIQEPNAGFGIRIAPVVSGNPFPETALPGDAVEVTGRMAGSTAERYLDITGNAIVVTHPGPGVPAPIALTGSAIGGARLNDYSPGLLVSRGPNNMGLLVTIYGEVTAIGSGFFYLDDGCGLNDGAGNVGVKVVADSTGRAVGEYVALTGISSCFDSGGLRPRILATSVVSLSL